MAEIIEGNRYIVEQTGLDPIKSSSKKGPNRQRKLLYFKKFQFFIVLL